MVLKEELTLPIHRITCWTDSTAVLAWLYLDCKVTVFAGTHIAEIQDLTARESWIYVDSANNPVNYITCGKHLQEFSATSRWFQGPAFLHRKSDQWPQLQQVLSIFTDSEEIKKAIFCGLIVAPAPVAPDLDNVARFFRVDGMLRHTTEMGAKTLHPIIPPPKHKITQFIIQHCDDQLHQYRSE